MAKKVRFKATLGMKQYLHAKASIQMVPHGSGMTRKVIPPTILRDGDVQEMKDRYAELLLARYPDNFTLVEPRKPKVEEPKESDL